MENLTVRALAALPGHPCGVPPPPCGGSPSGKSCRPPAGELRGVRHTPRRTRQKRSGQKNQQGEAEKGAPIPENAPVGFLDAARQADGSATNRLPRCRNGRRLTPRKGGRVQADQADELASIAASDDGGRQWIWFVVACCMLYRATTYNAEAPKSSCQPDLII